jgi:hypothetical protein
VAHQPFNACVLPQARLDPFAAGYRAKRHGRRSRFRCHTPFFEARLWKRVRLTALVACRIAPRRHV